MCILPSCRACANVCYKFYHNRPPWRNWLARSAVNRKVGGSSPPGGVYFLLPVAKVLQLSSSNDFYCLSFKFHCADRAFRFYF